MSEFGGHSSFRMVTASAKFWGSVGVYKQEVRPAEINLNNKLDGRKSLQYFTSLSIKVLQ